MEASQCRTGGGSGRGCPLRVTLGPRAIGTHRDLNLDPSSPTCMCHSNCSFLVRIGMEASVPNHAASPKTVEKDIQHYHLCIMKSNGKMSNLDFGDSAGAL